MSLSLNTEVQPQQTLQSTAQSQEQDSLPRPLEQETHINRRSESPVRPPVSPISPNLPPVQLASAAERPIQPPSQPKPASESHFIDPPPPLPIDEEDNTDAAALRAAISILQIQKEKSKQDIKTLQDLKNGLIEDPDAFTGELLAGRLREEKLPNDPLQATFNGADENTEDSDADTSTDAQVSATDAKQSSPSKYPKIPAAQNVVRCPPVNWAKYHIAGEPLDRMHQEQRTRPSLGEPARDFISQQYPYNTPLNSRAAEHFVFGPYDPQRDKYATPAEQMGVGVQTRRSSKRPDLGYPGMS